MCNCLVAEVTEQHVEHLSAAELAVTAEAFDFDVTISEELNLPFFTGNADFNQYCIANPIEAMPNLLVLQPVEKILQPVHR